jgi:hypothetical protein
MENLVGPKKSEIKLYRWQRANTNLSLGLYLKFRSHSRVAMFDMLHSDAYEVCDALEKCPSVTQAPEDHCPDVLEEQREYLNPKSRFRIGAKLGEALIS